MFWYYCVERAGTIDRTRYFKPLRIRFGVWLAKELRLQHKGVHRETRTIERDKYALCLKGILLGLVKPKPLTEVKQSRIPDRMQDARRPTAAGPRISRLREDEEGNLVTIELYGTGPQAGEPEVARYVTAIDAAWVEMTPAERRKATRKAAQQEHVTI